MIDHDFKPYADMPDLCVAELPETGDTCNQPREEHHRLNINDRVFAEGGDATPWDCMWFALCKNPANGLREGPIGNGQFGPIPICQRCDDKCERLKK